MANVSAGTVSLDKSLAYTRGYPIACACAEDGVTTAECDLFQCTCSCDVTAGVCDYNCCCDPDCSADQKSRFAAVGCASEGYTPDKIDLCYDSLELYKINPKLPLGGQPTASAAVGGALCVEKYNGATEVDYFKDTDVQSADIFTVSAGKKSYYYAASSGSLYSTDTGYFSIPASDFDGRCNDFNFAGFEQDVDPRSCQRELFSGNTALYTAQCEKDFSVARYVEDLYLASAANVRATTLNPTAVVEVTVNTISHVDQSTNAAQDVTAAWTGNNCDVPYCQNIVTSVVYTVTHASSAAGTITSVKADVVVTDFARDASVDTQVFTQTFGVDFISSFGGTSSQGSGNQVTRSKSGNPGYLMGKPVLVGELQAASGSTLQTIAQSTDGFQVSTSIGKCPAGSNKGYQSLSFGYDMNTGCQLELTRPELKNLCCTGSSDCTPDAPSPYAATSGWPNFLSLPAETQYVGVYGNADPLDVSQWTAVSVRSSSANSNWNAQTGVCTNMKSGLHYKFLVASSGEKDFPQSKIVGVEVEQVVSDWFSNIPYTDDVSTQTFNLEITASFVFKESSDLEGYVPPAPPVLFKVPHDVFYPFFISAAASKPAMSAFSILATVACTVALAILERAF
eukprot:GSChrysophyteH1.ASY1.ANO1.863.1 assembled CDS